MGMVLLLGGARSGKSDQAVRLANEAGRPVTFIATATPSDAEMAERILHHQRSRPVDWTTVQAPLELVQAVRSVAGDQFVVVDCLTLWVSNLMDAGRSDEEILQLAAEASHILSGRDAVVVSNEVGMGVVPVNALARRYRDVLGAVNKQFARCSQRALLMVSGMALELHPA